MKNTETTEKKSRVLNAVGGINDEFILEAAPTGRREKRSYRGLIAAAIGTAAAAAVVLVAAFGGKGKPNASVQQAQESEKPIVTETALVGDEDREVELKLSKNARLLSLGTASSGKEWDEINIIPEDPSKDDGIQHGYSHFDNWVAPTPSELILDPNTSVFRGVVKSVENYSLLFGKTSDSSMGVAIVVFDVTACYKGGLTPGSECRVFIDHNIGGIFPITPAIGEDGSGTAYYTQLRPGTEVIMLVLERSAEDGFGIENQDQDGNVLSESFFCYGDLAANCECDVRSGRIFFERDGEFFYDTEVYDKTMLGEEPTMDSAESFIKGLISGTGL